MILIKAPAKVNLFLEVTGKRKDGYHNLNTLFLKLKFFDHIRLKKIPQDLIKVECSHPDVPIDSTNLVYKAAELLKKKYRIKSGVVIKIKKNIPVGAGLGGGSSDAASTLMGLNDLWDLALSERDLMKLGEKLGADVPFFILPEIAAIGRGIGNRLRPITLDKRFWIVLVISPINVSTKDVYKELPRSLTNRNNGVKLLIHALCINNIDKIKDYLFNRLEAVTFRKYRQLAKIKEKMSVLGVGAVLMSGSGSVIFGIVKNREEAIFITRELHDAGQVKVVRSM